MFETRPSDSVPATADVIPEVTGPPFYPAGVTWSVREVADEVRRRQPGVPHLKLHKLLYYCQGHHLAHTGHRLFVERVSAWDHGPVVGALWFDEQRAGPAEAASAQPLDEAALNTIGYVLSRYGRLSGRDLEALTHSETPWLDADAQREPGTSVPIDIGGLRDFFRDAGRAGGDSDEFPPDSAVIRAFLERSAAGSSAGVVDSRETLEGLKTGA